MAAQKLRHWKMSQFFKRDKDDNGILIRTSNTNFCESRVQKVGKSRIRFHFSRSEETFFSNAGQKKYFESRDEKKVAQFRVRLLKKRHVCIVKNERLLPIYL